MSDDFPALVIDAGPTQPRGATKGDLEAFYPLAGGVALRGDMNFNQNNLVNIGDFWSSNWDGATPADLSSTEDTNATAGAYFDMSTGSLQLEGEMFVGGNVSLIGSGVFRSATSGRRIEMGVTPTAKQDPHLEWYTADGAETAAGFVRMYVDTNVLTGFLDKGGYAEIRTPEVDLGARNVYVGLQMWTEQDAAAQGTIVKFMAQGDTHTGSPLFTWDRTAGGSLGPWQVGFNAGTASAPSITFFDASAGVSDLDTGFYYISSNQVAIALAGTARFKFSAHYLTSFTTGGASLRGDGGSAALPAFTFTGDTDTGMYRPNANEVGLATNGSIGLQINSSQKWFMNVAMSTFSSGGYATVRRRDSDGQLMELISSQRFKKNIKARGPRFGDGILALRPVSFQAAEGPSDETNTSLIAEEVADVYPEFVRLDDSGTPLSIHYEMLTVPLIAAVKDIETRLAALEAA